MRGKRTSLSTDKAVQRSTATVYVFSDSVLCLGKLNPYPESIDAWKNKIEWFAGAPQCRELDRIEQNFPRIHYITDSRRDPENDERNAVWT